MQTMYTCTNICLCFHHLNFIHDDIYCLFIVCIVLHVVHTPQLRQLQALERGGEQGPNQRAGPVRVRLWV